MQDICICKLRNKQEYIPQIASIYIQEWSWHFREEWNITTYEEMIKDIIDNFLDDTYLFFTNKQFIGTFAILNSDLKSHLHLCPWFTCLYVIPEYRNRGYGTYMIETVKQHNPELYLWCYTEKERNLYSKLGFQLYEETLYNAKEAWILMWVV
jgi:GNAT superfamily N-acetyltransferase